MDKEPTYENGENLKQTIFVLAFFTLTTAVLWGKDVSSPIAPLNIRVLEDGAVLISDSFNEVAYVDPQIFTEGWKYFGINPLENDSQFGGAFNISPESQVKVASSIKISGSSLHFHYSLVPSNDVQVLSVRATIHSPYQRWIGGPYQVGLKTGKIPEEIQYGGIISQSDSGSITLGSAQPNGLTIQAKGEGLFATLQDDRKWGPYLSFAFHHGEATDKPWEWKAGENKNFDFTLKFNRMLKEVVPQEPKRPFPYKEEDVTFTNENSGITLAGTLTLPNQPGPFPAVLLIGGQGPEDRDGSSTWGHQFFLVLSDYLTRQGIAVLRYDKRGVGRSGGIFETAGIDDFADDALAGLEYLKARKEIDRLKVGLVGYSEGGFFSPWVATHSKGVAFIVSMAGSGLGGKKIQLIQMKSVFKAEGLSDKFISWAENTGDLVLREMDTSKDPADTKIKVNRILSEEYSGIGKSGLLNDYEHSAFSLWFSGDLSSSHWWRKYVEFDPQPYLAQLTCPVLLVDGDKDIYVPPGDNIPVLEKTLKAGRNPEFTYKVFPGLSHFFQICGTGLVGEKHNIPETIEPEVLEYIGDWIKRHSK